MATVADGVLKALALGISSIDELPQELRSAAGVREANFSFNAISGGLEALDGVAKSLETLVLDNNELTSLNGLPPLPQLRTLWVNNNAIADLEATLNVLSRQCPQLEYLSLLRNPCCPNELTGKLETEYRRYRLYTKYRLPTLRLLDAGSFTDQEALDAREKGKFCRAVATSATNPNAASDSSSHAPSSTALATTTSNIPPAADDAEEEDLFAKFEKKKAAPSSQQQQQAPQPQQQQPSTIDGGATASAPPAGNSYFTQQRHFYSGKTSEGNRFIKDDVL